MEFSFVLDNHFGLGRESIYDIYEPIAGQLVDLGHRVHFHDGTLRPDRINVICEGFDDSAIEALQVVKHPGTNDPILGLDGKPRGAKAAGYPIVIIATERPGKPGFNDSRTKEHIDRQRNFPAAAREAAAVWCLVPGVHRWAGQWAPAVDLELGWSESRTRFMRDRFGADTNALYDFSFYGSLTPRRRHIIAAIERRGKMVMTSEHNLIPFRDGIGIATADDLAAMSNVSNRSGFLTLDKRNAMIGNSKVVLGIHQFPGWRLVSNSRFSTALSLGRPVVNEPPPRDVETPWREVGVFSRSVGSFVDEAIAALDRWQELRDAQVEKFRAMFGPAQCVGAAVAQTLGELLAKEAA